MDSGGYSRVVIFEGFLAQFHYFIVNVVRTRRQNHTALFKVSHLENALLRGTVTVISPPWRL